MTKSPRDPTDSTRANSTPRDFEVAFTKDFAARLKNYGTSERRAIRSRPEHATVTL